MKTDRILLLLLILGALCTREAQAFYNPSTGRWLSRDPLGELGGINLYEFVQNNPILKMDKYGLMTIDDLIRLRNVLNALASSIKCCCDKLSFLHPQLTGFGIFSTVSLNVALETQGCVSEITYYWWDCATAQEEYDTSPHPASDGTQAWQRYGWRLGGSRNGGTHDGGPGGIFDRVDNHHWNWQAAVMFWYCGKGGHMHVGLDFTDPQEFTWNDHFQEWEGPHYGAGRPPGE